MRATGLLVLPSINKVWLIDLHVLIDCSWSSNKNIVVLAYMKFVLLFITCKAFLLLKCSLKQTCAAHWSLIFDQITQQILATQKTEYELGWKGRKWKRLRGICFSLKHQLAAIIIYWSVTWTVRQKSHLYCTCIWLPEQLTLIFHLFQEKVGQICHVLNERKPWYGLWSQSIWIVWRDRRCYFRNSMLLWGIFAPGIFSSTKNTVSSAVDIFSSLLHLLPLQKIHRCFVATSPCFPSTRLEHGEWLSSQNLIFVSVVTDFNDSMTNTYFQPC